MRSKVALVKCGYDQIYLNKHGIMSKSFVERLDFVLVNIKEQNCVKADDITQLLDGIPHQLMTVDLMIWLRDVKHQSQYKTVAAKPFIDKINSEIRSKLEEIDNA